MTMQATRPSTISAAHGRWREILCAVGIDSKFLRKKNGPCPICGGKDRWSYTDRHGDGDYICRSCGAGKGVQLVSRFKGCDFATAAREVDGIIGNLPTRCAQPERRVPKPDPNALANLYRGSKEVGDDAVSRYFISRCISGPYPKALRYVPVMWHYRTSTQHPGLIAVFFDVGGSMTSVQRLYLTEDGRKAMGKESRMNMHDHPMPAGGAVRLGAIAETMGIAEGVETALSARELFGMTVWAATSDRLLAAWEPPPEAKRITIFGDNDENHAGQMAAHTLANRLILEARRTKIERVVTVEIPHGVKDWNDVLMQRSKANEETYTATRA